MKLVNLGSNNTLLNQFVSEIRDVTVQNDRLRFRKNIERIGEVMAYEVSKALPYAERDVTTPLGTARVSVPNAPIVLGTILRAGLPFHQGFLNFFDQAENAFVSAYRKERHDTLNFVIEYLAAPPLNGKTLILVDPMLATGGSMELSYKALRTRGVPSTLHMAVIVATQRAVDLMAGLFPDDNVTLWCAAIDPALNERHYIVPGLGDAGDLCFGEKE